MTKTAIGFWDFKTHSPFLFDKGFLRTNPLAENEIKFTFDPSVDLFPRNKMKGTVVCERESTKPHLCSKLSLFKKF